MSVETPLPIEISRAQFNYREAFWKSAYSFYKKRSLLPRRNDLIKRMARLKANADISRPLDSPLGIVRLIVEASHLEFLSFETNAIELWPNSAVVTLNPKDPQGNCEIVRLVGIFNLNQATLSTLRENKKTAILSGGSTNNFKLTSEHFDQLTLFAQKILSQPNVRLQVNEEKPITSSSPGVGRIANA